MATAEQRVHFKNKGWVIIPSVLDAETARNVADSVRKEVLPIGLRGVDIAAMEKQLKAKGRDVSELITDAELRKEAKVSDTAIRDKGNTRKPFVSISKGMANVYYNEAVRDKVLLNPKVVEAIESLYQDLVGPEPGVGYILGRDRVGFKPKGATDMDIHLDKNLFSGKPWPHRVQAFVNLSCHPVNKSEGKVKRGTLTSRDVGGIELLSGSHHIFDLLGYWYKRELGTKAAEAEADSVPQQLRPGFIKKDLPRFLRWLNKLFDPKKLSEESDEVQALLAASGLTKSPKIELVCPIVQPGDLVCWDQRLAHRNTRNKSDTVRSVAYVTLLPKRYKTSKATQHQLFTDQAGSGHAGSNRDNDAERKQFADTWAQRTSVPDTPVSRKLLQEPLAEAKDKAETDDEPQAQAESDDEPMAEVKDKSLHDETKRREKRKSSSDKDEPVLCKKHKRDSEEPRKFDLCPYCGQELVNGGYYHSDCHGQNSDSVEN